MFIIKDSSGGARDWIAASGFALPSTPVGLRVEIASEQSKSIVIGNIARLANSWQPAR